jgi:hypothetical protein
MDLLEPVGARDDWLGRKRPMNLTTRVRYIQSITDWSYQTCLQRIRELGDQPSLLASQNNWSILQADAHLLLPPEPSVKGAVETVEEEIIVDEIQVHRAAEIVVICEKGPFRPYQLVIPPEIAQNFLIGDIKVGRNSQFLTSDPIPASFFTDPTKAWYFDLMPRGMTSTLTVVSLRGESVCPFSATVKGDLLTADLIYGTYHQSRSTNSFFGLRPTTIPPKAKVRIAQHSQVIIKPHLMIIPPDDLEGLNMLSVRVAGVEVLSKEPPQAGKFSLVSPPTLQLSDWFCVDVYNTTDEDRVVHGSVEGALINC